VREEEIKYEMSTGSFSTSTASEEGSGMRLGAINDGEESDPEDSKTLRYAPSRSAPGFVAVMSPPVTAFSDAGFPRITPQILRGELGTSSPKPHHPPRSSRCSRCRFPLLDVEVEQVALRSTSRTSGLRVTAEEIKVVVCSTWLWLLVIREGFGGVARVSRKGDGWRIRA